MFDNYKIIAVTPAGRKKYLEILLPYILINRDIIDEYHLWINTTNKNDISYMEELAKSFPDFIKLIRLNIQPSGNYTIRFFFRNCVRKDTIYLRIDDDICWIGQNAIQELLRFRIQNPEYFIIYANIINNSICSYINQRNGNLGFSQGTLSYNVFCDKGWKSGEFASFIHTKFLDDYRLGKIKNYQYNFWILYEFERVSVNFIAWFGKDFAEFDGMVSGEDEEKWLSVDKPQSINRYNCICGSAIVSHFSYYTQREYLESQTKILERYKEISLDIFSRYELEPKITNQKAGKLEDITINAFDLAQNLILNHTPKIEPIITSESRPFWSVMIPTYNCASYLVETLKSVLAQDPRPEQMQIEVVDDCSTEDDPEAVVREIGQGRVSFYRQPQNGGIANNFNTCIQRAKGEWVHILHGDDAVLPGFYNRLRESIEQEPNLGAAFTRCIFIDENSTWKQLSNLQTELPGIIPSFWKNLAIANTIYTPSIVVKRRVYEQIGGFHTQLSHTADWEMWKRISVYYPIWFEPQPLALYREHSKSDTSRLMQTGSNINQSLKAINISELYLPKEYSTNLSNQAKEVTARSGLNKAYRMLLERGDIYGAVNQIRESIKCSISPVVLNSFASLLTQSEILLQLVANMFICTNDETLFSNIVTEINNSEFDQNIAINLKDINLVIFPDWQIQEELLYDTLILVVKKIFSLPNCENINLLIYNNQINDEDANIIISDVVFHIYRENGVDITEEPGISIISYYSESQWRILLKKINAHIIMEYENYQVIQNLPPNTIPSFNLNELENKNIFI